METKTYKFGIAGTGLIAPFQAKAIQAMEGAELVAFHGRNAERVKELAAEYGCAGYTDYDEFLKHDGLDVVSVCTASGAHRDPTIAAANAGKHVVVEKPLEVTTERVDEMIAACARNNVTLAGVFPPPLCAVGKTAQAGRRCRTVRTRHHGGCLCQMVALAGIL